MVQTELDRPGETSLKLEDSTANPGPIGLMAFGMTTVLLNMANAGLFGLGTMVLSMGIFYGGLAQVIAGIMEWRKGNTFASAAFISYGFFWLSLVGLLVLPELGWGQPNEPVAMAAYLAMWGLFTLVMFFGTLRLNRMLQLIFGSLVVLFLLLAVGDVTGNAFIKVMAGFEGIICGLLAIYTALAQILNEVYGRIVWPIWPVTK
ncbi:MAG: acetate uptake transporter [Chloroflexi bacterium]|nr:acetate uptake transporter [Chloroflexota bacterium]